MIYSKTTFTKMVQVATGSLFPRKLHGEFTEEEDMIICTLFSSIGSRWSIIAAQLPGRTDNDIKNYWNTKLKKRLISTVSNSNIKPQLISPHNKIKSSLMLLNSSSASQYNGAGSNYYNAPGSNTLSFTGFNQSSSSLLGISSNSLRASAILQSAQLQQTQSHLSSPTPTQSSYPVFAGAPEPSCSSSDATNSGEQGISFHNSGYFYNGSSSMEEDDQKNNSSMEFLGSDKPQIKSDPFLWEEQAPLIDYGLEEIKQLITTTAGNSFYY
ncbi:hypothetical protein V2J09_009751 [Rumex salicifolius]